MDSEDVLAAARQCELLLESAVGADWSVPIPGLERGSFYVSDLEFTNRDR
jgi:hypothetical protein